VTWARLVRLTNDFVSSLIHVEDGDGGALASDRASRTFPDTAGAAGDYYPHTVKLLGSFALMVGRSPATFRCRH
jgi:hypothetical protein